MNPTFIDDSSTCPARFGLLQSGVRSLALLDPLALLTDLVFQVGTTADGFAAPVAPNALTCQTSGGQIDDALN